MEPTIANVPAAKATSAWWIPWALGIGSCSVLNAAAAFFCSCIQLQWTPLFGCGVGALAAEIYLISAYLAFTTQPWMPRLLTSWLAGLCLLAGLGLGLLGFEMNNTREEALQILGMLGISACVLTVAGAIGLLMLSRLQGIHWARTDSNEQRRTTSPRWSIFDLIVLTIIVAISFGLLRWTPIRFANTDQWAEFAAGMFTAAVFAAMSAPVTCLVTMYLLIRCDGRHTAWRPIHLALLLACLALVVLAGAARSREPGRLIVSTVFAAMLSYPTTIVAALMAVQALGWQLEWEQSAQETDTRSQD